MFQNTGMLFCYTESPLHAGSGSSVSAIDLPIQREAHTEFPLVQSSGWKGALRDECRQVAGLTQKRRSELQAWRKSKDQTTKPDHTDYQKRLDVEKEVLPWEIVFGPETDRADEHGGSLAVTDARLLLFPVRSLVGVFAWLTCPLVIERFRRDLARVSGTIPEREKVDGLSLQALQEGECWECRDSDVRLDPNSAEIVLEDFSFAIANGANQASQERLSDFGEWLAKHAVNTAQNSYLASRLKTGLVLVSDTVFRDFVRHSTEVVTRIRVNDETGTVDTGALWNVENLPSDCLLYSLALAMDPPPASTLWKQLGYDAANRLPQLGVSDAAGVLATFRGWVDQIPLMQLGGDQSVGRGLITLRSLPPPPPSASITSGQAPATSQS